MLTACSMMSAEGKGMNPGPGNLLATGEHRAPSSAGDGAGLKGRPLSCRSLPAPSWRGADCEGERVLATEQCRALCGDQAAGALGAGAAHQSVDKGGPRMHVPFEDRFLSRTMSGKKAVLTSQQAWR